MSYTTRTTIKRILLPVLALLGIFLIILILASLTAFAAKQWRDGWPFLLSDDSTAITKAEPVASSAGQINNNSFQSTANSSAPQLPLESTTEEVPIVTTAEFDQYGILRPKPVILGAAGARPSWTATPLPTSTPTATPNPYPTFIVDPETASASQPIGLNPGEKWIDVNLTTQTLMAFEGSKPVYQTLVSTGTAYHPTVTGQFRIWLRFPSQDMNGYRLGYDYYLQNVPYVQYFYQDYALHGTYWHNNFGNRMSHGCVNLPTPASEWLYNWASKGTLVNIHN